MSDILFTEMFNHSLAWEGHDLTKVKDDRGSLTKFGISQRAFPDLDIENLSANKAKEIYYKYFYLPNTRLFLEVKEDAYVHQMKIEIFDAIVNTGQGNAIRTLQRTLNGFSELQLKEDGIAGMQTCNAWDSINHEGFSCCLLYNFRANRGCYYRLIVENDKTQQKFLNGWLRRAFNNYQLL